MDENIQSANPKNIDEIEFSSSRKREEMKRLLAGTGRNIDEFGGFDIEIKPDRTREDTQ